jgi:hypothetical protein
MVDVLRAPKAESSPTAGQFTLGHWASLFREVD